MVDDSERIIGHCAKLRKLFERVFTKPPQHEGESLELARSITMEGLALVQQIALDINRIAKDRNGSRK